MQWVLIMNNLRILGLLAARAGSKGIPGKNLRLLCDRPLLAWAADAIVNAPSVERAICSTDDVDIEAAARICGLEIAFRRPADLASDSTPVADVIRHAVDTVDDPMSPYTHVALVQATTPTVKVEDVENAIKLVREGNADTVITGFHAGSHHPAIMFTISASGSVSWLFEKQANNRRQNFPDVFIRTGLVYIISTKVLRETGTIYGNNIQALVVNENRAVTIDEERDFRLAMQLMEDVCGK